MYPQLPNAVRRWHWQSEPALDAREFASLLSHLGVVLKYLGAFEDAETEYREALALIEQARELDHPDVAPVCHNLGGLEHARRRFAAGEPYGRRSLEI
jgi:Flp pilus assembly protein TadD